MASKKIACARCKKIITGKASVVAKKRTIGKKNKFEVDFYDSKCFKKLNKERSWHVYKQEESARKRKNNIKV